MHCDKKQQQKLLYIYKISWVTQVTYFSWCSSFIVFRMLTKNTVNSLPFSMMHLLGKGNINCISWFLSQGKDRKKSKSSKMFQKLPSLFLYICITKQIHYYVDKEALYKNCWFDVSRWDWDFYFRIRVKKVLSIWCIKYLKVLFFSTPSHLYQETLYKNC